jgi:hypothetical protein
MHRDERDLLDVLKSELEFLDQHGYRRSPETAWRPRYIFEDSPSCINHNATEHRHPCNDCVLAYVVPSPMRSAKFPCRHIPLNASGETLDSLYRYSDPNEIEDTVRDWLKANIQRLQEQRAAVSAAHNKSSLIGTPLYSKQHPKCANPACPAAFHWTSGGKFFRFRPDTISAPDSNAAPGTGAIHGAKHYWLCEPCSHVFTLIYEEPLGVMVKLLWPELPGAAREKAAAAANGSRL